MGSGAGNREIWACPTSYTRSCGNTLSWTPGQRLLLAEQWEGFHLEFQVLLATSCIQNKFMKRFIPHPCWDVSKLRSHALLKIFAGKVWQTNPKRKGMTTETIHLWVTYYPNKSGTCPYGYFTRPKDLLSAKCCCPVKKMKLGGRKSDFFGGQGTIF